MNIFSFALEDGSVRPFVPIEFAKNPRWSPDGRRIVFHGEDHLGWAAPTDSLDLYTLDRDGQNLVRLTHNVIADIHPAW
jgi:Tol biopolymer transport system component